MCVTVELVNTAPGAVVHSRCTYLKSQVRIKGDNKIYERDADSGFKIRFHFCPNCEQRRLLGRRPDPNTYGITVDSFADPNFPPQGGAFG